MEAQDLVTKRVSFLNAQLFTLVGGQSIIFGRSINLLPPWLCYQDVKAAPFCFKANACLSTSGKFRLNLPHKPQDMSKSVCPLLAAENTGQHGDDSSGSISAWRWFEHRPKLEAQEGWEMLGMCCSWGLYGPNQKSQKTKLSNLCPTIVKGWMGLWLGDSLWSKCIRLLFQCWVARCICGCCRLKLLWILEVWPQGWLQLWPWSTTNCLKTITVLICSLWLGGPISVAPCSSLRTDGFSHKWEESRALSPFDSRRPWLKQIKPRPWL